jgi:acyl-coenzyme A thioesterase PaaI-like protein
MQPQAFQDLIPNNHCYGCGPQNLKGLQIKSYWQGGIAVCRFEPRAEHSAGPLQFLNGGITATLIDCHSVCTAIAYAYEMEQRAIGIPPEIWCVTASLHVDYLKPIPLAHPVDLAAKITREEGKKIDVECKVLSGEALCAQGQVLAVKVAASWKQMEKGGVNGN